MGTQQQEVECRYENVFGADMCLGFFFYCYNVNMFVAFFCTFIPCNDLKYHKENSRSKKLHLS